MIGITTLAVAGSNAGSKFQIQVPRVTIDQGDRSRMGCGPNSWKIVLVAAQVVVLTFFSTDDDFVVGLRA